MPLTFRCPECRNLVSVDEQLAGLHGRCPACAAAIQFPVTSSAEVEGIQAGPAPLPPSSQNLENSFTAKPTFTNLSDGWKTVRVGLAMIVGGLAALATLILVSLFVGLMDHARPETSAKLGEVVFYLWLIGLGVALLTIFLGLCVCCATPTQAQAREFALLSLLCFVLAGICIVVYALSLKAWIDQAMNEAFRNVAVQRHPGPLQPRLWSLTTIALLLGGVFGLASHILFVFYLRHLARFFAEESLFQNTGLYLRFLLILAALNIVIAFVPEQNNPRLLFWLSQAISFAGAIMLFWLMYLIQRTQEALAAALKQRI
jgi:hypothetical protein